MSGSTLSVQPPNDFRQPWELYALVGTLITLSAFVTIGNVSQVSPVFLALSAMAVGQALLLAPIGGLLGGLAAAGFWVLFRRTVGIWTGDELAQSLSELFLLSVNVALAIRYRLVWQRQQLELQDLRSLQQLLVAGEVGTGLLPRQVGDLRIQEEVDRSRQFRRPLGLLIMEVLPHEDHPGDIGEVYQAVERRLASASLIHDVPFRFEEHQLGLLLPERGWDRIYKDTEDVIGALNQASFLNSDGRTENISDYVKLHFGLGIYDGEDLGSIDLVKAAKDSLEIARDLTDLGEAPISALAIPATPITEATFFLPRDEE